MGARPMARLIQEKLKKALAEEILFGSLSDGGEVSVTADDDIRVTVKPRNSKAGERQLSAADS